MRLFGIVLACACAGMPQGLSAQSQKHPDVAGFNYVIGTQTIGPGYRFTTQDAILESSKAILEMGSSIIKAAGVSSRALAA